MRFVMGRAVTLCAILCISQEATAQSVLRFWTAAGDHGVAACVFQATLPTTSGGHGMQRLDFSISADPSKPRLIGKVRLRQAGLPLGPRQLKMGAGAETLLDLILRPRDADTAIGDVPGDAMADLLRSLATHAQVWTGIADGTGKHGQRVTLSVGDDADNVSSCISAIERDLESQRRDDSSAGFRTTYSPLQFDW